MMIDWLQKAYESVVIRALTLYGPASRLRWSCSVRFIRSAGKSHHTDQSNYIFGVVHIPSVEGGRLGRSYPQC